MQKSLWNVTAVFVTVFFLLFVVLLFVMHPSRRRLWYDFHAMQMQCKKTSGSEAAHCKVISAIRNLSFERLFNCLNSKSFCLFVACFNWWHPFSLGEGKPEPHFQDCFSPGRGDSHRHDSHYNPHAQPLTCHPRGHILLRAHLKGGEQLGSFSPSNVLHRTSRPPWRWTSFRGESQGCVTLTLTFRCRPLSPPSFFYIFSSPLWHPPTLLPNHCPHSHAVALFFALPVALPLRQYPLTSFLKKCLPQVQIHSFDAVFSEKEGLIQEVSALRRFVFLFIVVPIIVHCNRAALK